MISLNLPHLCSGQNLGKKLKSVSWVWLWWSLLSSQKLCVAVLGCEAGTPFPPREILTLAPHFSLLLGQQINSSTLLVLLFISDFEILPGEYSYSVSQSHPQCFESNVVIPLFWYSYPVFCQGAKLLSDILRSQMGKNIFELVISLMTLN